MKHVLIALSLAAVSLAPTLGHAESEPICLEQDARLVHPFGEGDLQLRVGEPLLIQGYERAPSFSVSRDGEELVLGVAGVPGTFVLHRVTLPADVVVGDILEVTVHGGANHRIEVIDAAQDTELAVTATLCRDERYSGQNTVRIDLTGHPNAVLVRSTLTQTPASNTRLALPAATGELWLHSVLKGGCLDLTVEDLSTGALSTQQLCDDTPCWPADEGVLYREDPAVALNLDHTPDSATGACPYFDNFTSGPDSSCTTAATARTTSWWSLLLRR